MPLQFLFPQKAFEGSVVVPVDRIVEHDFFSLQDVSHREYFSHAVSGFHVKVWLT